MEKYVRYIVQGQKDGDIASYSTQLYNMQHSARDFAMQNARMFHSWVFGELDNGEREEIYAPKFSE